MTQFIRPNWQDREPQQAQLSAAAEISPLPHGSQDTLHAMNDRNPSGALGKLKSLTRAVTERSVDRPHEWVGASRRSTAPKPISLPLRPSFRSGSLSFAASITRGLEVSAGRPFIR